ncbi:MAG: hypothetical protein ACK5JN_05125 [Kluyvera sp.]
MTLFPGSAQAPCPGYGAGIVLLNAHKRSPAKRSAAGNTSAS